MDKIIVIGGKGTAVIIAEQIYDTQQRFGKKIEFLGFAFDDEAFGDSINDFPILCKTYNAYKEYGKYEDVKFIYSLYRPDLLKERVALRESYNIPLDKYYTFIHPSALVTRSVKMGVGNVILANTVVNSNAVIGNFNTINVNCLIGHEAVIGNNNFFAGHVTLGSNTKMGKGNFIGVNSSLKNFITIGDDSIVGMCSNATKDIETGQVVYGNPAKVMNKINNPIR